MNEEQEYTIQKYFKNKKSLINKILKLFRNLIPNTDFSNDKLGGPGSIIQIDETMMNFKCKSHRGRSTLNKTDALVIIEYQNKIKRAFAKIIPNKESRTIIPIVVSQVASSSIIWTDEHKSYKCLKNLGFEHDSVCHKYEFGNKLNGINTQAVESFNNCIKIKIKRQKGVKPCDKEEFLKCFLFFFNNKKNLLKRRLKVIRIG
ncbi:hypothetical protein H311_00198 [Anncaliia algerae PRA109]|nr:hypothetical protein H311_00198 [Anncaliia algerae PRA109]